MFRVVPVGGGFAMVSGGWSSALGPFAKAEVGFRPWEPLAIYGMAQVTREEAFAGIMAEVRW